MCTTNNRRAMNEIIEKLACRLGEGFQASVLCSTEHGANAFHRQVTTFESSDLSFVKGLVSTGLRGSALLDGDQLIGNYNQLLTVSRQHIPLVVNTSARVVEEGKYSALNNYDAVRAVQQTGCFQFVATSLQEEIFFTLIAHRITELSLIPGIVIADYTSTEEHVKLPADRLITQYLGNPDDQIECPTPAQEMIFGRTRRRVPNWFSLDLPVMLGARKDGEAIFFEVAASQKYFYDHLSTLISQAFSEFYEVFGTQLSTVSTSGASSDYILVSTGGQVSRLFNALEERGAQLLTIHQLNPFPEKEVAEILKGKKGITLLESASGTAGVKSIFHHTLLNAINGSTLYSAKYGAGLSAGALKKAIQHMTSGASTKDYFLDLAFTKPSANYPKHQILLDEVEKQYPKLINAAISAETETNSPSLTSASEVPLAIRLYEDKGPNYSWLSRFYDNTAFFYDTNERSELVADPFSGVPIVPSASAGFFSHSAERTHVPSIDIQQYTGDGDDFVNCPHSALLPIVIGVEGLMRTGIDLATSNGATISKLTPMVKNLAKVVAKTIDETEGAVVRDFLSGAFESLVEQMKLESEKLTIAQDEFNAVLEEIGGLPVVVTDNFFKTPNAQNPGSGEFFSLAVNPASCTGCGMCAQLNDAITMEPQNTENLTKITEGYKLWEQLPDTTGDTINRLFHDKNYSSLAAMFLSRNYLMSMSGASASESDNPYKSLLHIITATAESVVQPKVVGQISQIDELIVALSDNVHGTLSKALPKENLDSLSKALKNTRGEKLSFQELLSRIANQGQNKLMDTKALTRKTELVDALKSLKWVLEEGPTGVGRARYGMLIAGEKSMNWAKQYPANNFSNPSIIYWNGSAPEQTLGLFHGQLRYLLDNVKLLRRAALEAKDKYDPQIHNTELITLGWEDLTDDEKKLIPPILLIAEKDDLKKNGWNSLNKLLVEKYPVKVFLFNNSTSPTDSAVSDLTQTMAGMFSSIALKKAYVYQGGMANQEHLFNGLMDGLDRTYPALFNLYATSFAQHENSWINWTEYAALAESSRAFPSLRFDPGEKDDFLQGAIDLEGNSEYKEDWVSEDIQLSEENTITYKINWADWAFTQTNWLREFWEVEEDSSNIPVTDFILLNEKGRKGKIPVIQRANKTGLKYYAVSNRVVEMTKTILSNWNTLQELAGLRTEFPQKLKDEVTRELSVKFEKDVTELTQNYEQQLKEKESEHTEKLRQQLKEKLVALSGMAKN